MAWIAPRRYYIFTKIPLCCLPCCISLCRSDYIFRASALHTFSTHLSVRQRHKSMTDWQIRCYEVYERCLGHLPLCYESNLRTFSPPLFHIVNNTCHSTSSGRTIHHIYPWDTLSIPDYPLLMNWCSVIKRILFYSLWSTLCQGRFVLNALYQVLTII